MLGITGFYGYPNQYTAIANPTGMAANQLAADYARDFGLGTSPVYNLPIDVSMGYGYNAGMGMYPGMGMGMMGLMNPYMMPTKQYLEYLNMDFKDRLEYDQDLRNIARENAYTDGKSSKNYASATDGLTGSIREACNSLQTVIVEGESDQIVTQFERIVNALRNSPLYERLKSEFKDDPARLEMTLRNCAKEQFQAATGQDMKAMIQQHCDSELVNSFWNTISFGNAQNYSAEDVIAKIEGSYSPKSTSGKRIVGKVGGVLAGIGTGAVAGLAVGALGGPIGWIGGAIVGGVAGLIGAFTS